MFDPVASRIDLALAAMNAELPTDTPELDALFAKLRTVSDNAERRATTQRIWRFGVPMRRPLLRMPCGRWSRLSTPGA